MRTLTSQQWAEECRAALNSVFRTFNPFGTPVADQVRQRAILFPIAYMLDKDQFDALFDAAHAVGDETVCVSVTEGRDKLVKRGDVLDWQVQRWEYEEYRDLPTIGVLENAIFSPRGTWGLLISHEQHAIVAGELLFMRTLAAEFPGYNSASARFLEYWKFEQKRSGADIAWLMPLFTHIYGEESAKIWARDG